MIQKKKLIEVALPLDAINKESLHRKQKAPKGWPTSFHKWWAQRPLAAARAVIFAQMVDDPSVYVDVLRADPKLRRKAESALKARMKLWEEATALAKKAKGTSLSVPEPGPAPTLDEMLADQERQRLFRIIEDLVQWDNTTNEAVLQAARREIWQSWRRTCAENADHPRAKELFDRHKLPPFWDPFAGSGSLPLSAQWLGLESYASDLNPVAVLINKAMIEIPQKFAGNQPVNPESRREKSLIAGELTGTSGLANDVRYYCQWIRDEAEKRIGHIYPKVEVTTEMAKERRDLRHLVGQKLTVIAWLWTRTVRCPNPGCGCEMPLLSSCVLSSKEGREAYLNPVVEGKRVRFDVQTNVPKSVPDPRKGFKRGMSGIFECACCGTVTTRDYVAQQAMGPGLASVQTAIVADSDGGRVYLSAGTSPVPKKLPPVDTAGLDVELAPNPRDVWCRNFGLHRPMDLFTPRQLVAMVTFSDLVQEARMQVKRHAIAASMPDDDKLLRDGGIGAVAYADAIAVYLGCVIDRMAYYGSSLTTWLPKDNALRDCMPRQALPMAWDYAEGNPLGKSSGDVSTCSRAVANYLEVATVRAPARAVQADAQAGIPGVTELVISTDPPYYDNISYADLSDFFYVWLRRSLRAVYPDLFSTLAVPKAEELVATAYRHGTKKKAEAFFLDGMTQVMHSLVRKTHPAFPVTIYYAFKQSESDGTDGTTNTGWDTFLDAVVRAGFAITGTWPMRTEGAGRMVASGTNALASSIVLVCRPREADALIATRREFVAALKAELPIALAHLQRGNIAPVDLAQAAIGPGMGVYTRYSRVLDAEGKALSVREALSLINQTLDEALAEQEGDFDPDSRWAITWFEQVGFEVGEYGTAEQLSKSKNTSVSGLVEAGILASKGGKVRLLKPNELPDDWDPTTDKRLTSWETVHHLIRVLEAGGEGAAAKIVSKLGAKAEVARELCYRLYTLCERKKRATEALSYNGLVQSWPEITRLARESESMDGTVRESQTTMYGQE